jgi:hypothetical protein
MSPYGRDTIGNAVFIKAAYPRGYISSVFDSLGGRLFSNTPQPVFWGRDIPGRIKASAFICSTGTSISAFSIDGSFSANSDYNVPT